MPARHAPQGLSVHPQLQKMIEAHLSGQSAREISRWSNPQVAHNTVSRYIRSRVAPAIAKADAFVSVAPQINDRNATLRANLPDSPRKEQVEHLATQALLGAPALSMFRQRLEKLHACADRALDRAETSVRVVKDERGRLVAVGADLSPIAPLLNQAHKNLEMLGRATGELELVGGPSLSIQIICPSAPADAMPRVTFMSDDAIDAEGEEQIGLLQR